MSDHIITSVQDRILKIGINRPDKKNALTAAMYTAMAGAFVRAQEDPSIRVIYLTGSGNVFSSGNDIVDFIKNPPASEESPVSHYIRAIAAAGKPVVAAVRGAAVGIGTTMLLHFDLVYAGEGARFQLPFVNLGLVPEAGSSMLLPLAAGTRKASEIFLLGDSFGAADALEAGIVNAVFPDDAVEDEAWKKARLLAEKPPEALRITKALMKRRVQPFLEETIREEGRLFSERLGSPEASEAFKAFVEKRKPDFSRF